MTAALAMPSIALPTGPYDWHPERLSRAVFDGRIAGFRAAMAACGVTHAVVHGNGFDHGALAWLTHFTPKLGPAYALVPATGTLRLLFAGGPGMKPSAQRLTWIEDVAAVKSIEGDARRWLDDAGGGGGGAIRLGLVEGTSMLRADWKAVQRAASGEAVPLDDAVDKLRQQTAPATAGDGPVRGALALAERTITALARPGTDLRMAAIEMERAAYAAGAQDVRVLIGRRPGGPPTTPPDGPLPMTGPTRLVVALRFDGVWATTDCVLEG